MSSLLKSSLTYAPSMIVPRAFGYIIVIVFTRLLAPAEFGLYALVLTYGEILDKVFMHWNRLGMLRFLLKGNKRIDGGLVKANLYCFGISIVPGLFGAVLLSLSVSNSTSTLKFFFAVTLYLIGNASMRFSLMILRALDIKKIFVLLEVIRPTFSFACIFLAIPIFGLSYSSLVFGFFSATALFGIGSIVWTTKDYHHSSPDWQSMQQMLHYALPLILTFLLSSIIKGTDRFMLNALSGTAMVGLYAASYSLSRPAFELLFNTINLGAFPNLINLYEKKGEEAAAEQLKNIINIQIWMGFPMVAGIAILASPLAQIMLGAEYRHAAIVLMPLMALAGLLTGMKSLAYDLVFHLKQTPMILNYCLLFAAVINVCLNYWFILFFGVYGAAWGTWLACLLALVLSIILSGKLISVPFPYKDTGVAFLSSFIMWLSLSFILAVLPENDLVKIFVTVPAGIGIYFLASFLFGAQLTKRVFSQINLKMS